MSSSHPTAEPARRPTPSRVSPDRSVGGMFRRTDEPEGTAPGTAAAGTPGAADPHAGGPGAAGPGAPRSAAQQAVRTAYEIVDRYFSEGRDAARAPTADPSRSDPMRPRPDEMFSTMMRVWQDTARMWSGYMSPYLPGNPSFSSLFGGDGSWEAGGPDTGGRGDPGAANPAAGAPSGAAAGAHPSRASRAGGFVAEVDAPGPARLFVELFRAVGEGAVVPALWPVEPADAAPLRGVQVRVEAGVPVFAVTVPRGQAPGRYEGPVRDAAGATVGMVSLSFRAPAGS